MAVSESVLNAVNLFSSTSVFNANKGSVGATDLNFIKQTTAELATEGGGIIAQSLGTNGYVKFANGLILQWGIVTDSTNGNQQRMFSFPIAYSDINYSVVVASSYTELTSYGWGYINTKTTTYVTARVAGYTTHFIVIGK